MTKAQKISRALDRFFDRLIYVPTVLLSLLILICLMTVTLRQFLIGKFNWSDEAMRFLLVYVAFLSLPILVAQKRNISVDLTDVMFPHNIKGRMMCHLASDVLILAFLAVLLPACAMFIRSNLTGYSAAMHIPLCLVYLCIPLGFVLSMVAACNNIYKDLEGEK